jgi:hypothetical protein
VSTLVSAFQRYYTKNVRFMACFYLQTLQKHYRVVQRTVRRWCEEGRVPGAYRPTTEKQWRVRKPKDFDRWQAEVMEKLGPPPKIDALVLSSKKRPFHFKLRTEGEFEKWNPSEMQDFGMTMVDVLAALVRLNVLEPTQYDPKLHVKGCRDGIRLALLFKSGAGRNYYRNDRVEERLIYALRDAGWDAENGWRERGRGMNEADRWSANKSAVHHHA